MTRTRTTQHLPVSRPPFEDCFESWNSAVCTTFVPLQAVPKSCTHSQFREVLHAQHLGSVQLAEVPGGAVNVRRTPRLIRSGEPGLIKLGLQLEGSCRVQQRDRQTVLRPGDFALYETGVPYELDFPDDFRMLVFMFPRQLLRCPDRFVDAIAARRIEGKSGVGALVTPLLRELDQQLRNGALPGRAEVADGVLSLVAASVNEELRDEFTDADNPVLARARAFIDAHAADPDLDTRVIAGALRISVRYLQRLFEREGDSVGAYIRRLRLERCHQDLVNPTFAGLTIATIASRHGLVDAAYFSRLFKETYGRSPRAVRNERESRLGSAS